MGEVKRDLEGRRAVEIRQGPGPYTRASSTFSSVQSRQKSG